MCALWVFRLVKLAKKKKVLLWGADLVMKFGIFVKDQSVQKRNMKTEFNLRKLNEIRRGRIRLDKRF